MTNPVFSSSSVFGQRKPAKMPAGAGTTAQRPQPPMPSNPMPPAGFPPAGQVPPGQAPYTAQAPSTAQTPYQAYTGQAPYTGAPQPGTMDAAQLQQLYSTPSAGPVQRDKLTYDDVIIKTAGLLVLLVATAALTWFVAPGLLYIGLVGGLVFGLISAFKRKPVPALIILYAAFEGMFLGGMSYLFEQLFPGIVLQAVLASTAVFAVSLLLFSSGKVRVTPKLVRFLLLAMCGYLLYSLVNVGFILFSDTNAMFGLNSAYSIMGIPLGVVVGIVAVGLAAMSLIVDFDGIKQGVEAGAPRIYAWQGAFGLVVTLVWLYLELLRLLAIFRN